MYQSYYQLDLDPFRLTPDPQFAYPHPGFRDAMSSMQTALQRRDGIVVVTGRPGTGKTTLCEEFLVGCKAEQIPTIVVVASQLAQGEFLYLVARALQIHVKELASAALLEQIEAVLLTRPHSVLIVDEAQNLSDAALHEVLALSGLQRESRHLLQVYLVGQENLTVNLDSHTQQLLRGLITRVHQLGALDLLQTTDYILHRLGRAGWVGKPSISAEALVLVHRFSLGLPRHICKLSSRLLTHGMVQELSTLDRRCVTCVVAELEEEMLMPTPGAQSFPALEELQVGGGLELGELVDLTSQERKFLADSPAVVTEAPGVIRIAAAPSPAMPAPVFKPVGPSSLAPESAATNRNKWWATIGRYYRYAAVIFAIAMAGYFLGTEPSAKPVTTETGKALKKGRQPTMSNAEIADAGSEPMVVPGPAPTGPAVTPGLETAAVNLARVPAANRPRPGVGTDAVIVAAETARVIVERSAITSISMNDELEKLLRHGGSAMKQNYLTTPDELNAYYYYTQVLRLDPGNKAGMSGLQEIATRYGLMAMTMIEQKRYKVASVFVQRGLTAVGGDSQLLVLQRQLASQVGAVQQADNQGVELAGPENKDVVGVL